MGNTDQIFARIKAAKLGIGIFFIGIVAVSVYLFGGYLSRQQSALSLERESLTFTGTIEARTAKASFKVPGRIGNLLVDEGAKVEEGQLLANLESRELEAKLTQAQGAWTAAQAQVEQARESVALTTQQVESSIEQVRAKVEQAEVGVNDARLTLERTTALYASGVGSQKNLDDAQNAYLLAEKILQEAQAGLAQAESARMKVRVAQAQYEMALGQCQQAEGADLEAKACLENTKLICPLSGYVTAKYLENGEMVNAGTPVFEITDLQNTYVKIFVSEEKIGRISLNQAAEVTLDA
ncbi:MAG: biotin/lipoyl-binding protein, partial [Syntrophomonadaceae bacterium]|nr:biotin/lipoyl-binding protein [Syntrophomonadaceae bacterium]